MEGKKQLLFVPVARKKTARARRDPEKNPVRFFSP
jgi:hypothetical protein